jgi:HEAT repeat protein
MERADGSDEPPSGLDAELLPLLASEELRIRQQVALALAAAGAELPKLFALYNKSLPAEKPSDARARMLALEPVDDPDDWRSRQGVALTLAARG